MELADAEVATGNVVPGRRVAATLSAKGLNVTLSNISIAPLDVGKWQGEASLDGVIVALEGLQQPVEFRSGSLKLSAGKLTTDFRGRLGSALEFDGSLQAANVENAVPSFQLHTKELDLDALMAAFGEGTSTGAARPAAGRSELVAQGKLAADRLVSKPYQATDVSAHLRIYTDRTEVAPVQAQLYGGTLQISARADKTQVPQRFTANVQLRNLNMAALADASPDTRGKVSGTGELNLQLAGALGGDPLRTLTGSGNLAVRDGRLPGFNFGQAVKTAGTLAGFGNALSGDTPFSFMGGDLSIANQRTATQNLRLASPQGNVNLRGSLGFDRTLDFEGDVSLVASGSTSAQNVSDVVTGILGRVMKQNISRITVPISITGKFSDPKIRPSGAPRIETSKQDPTQTQTQGTQPQQQKKSILDLFRKP